MGVPRRQPTHDFVQIVQARSTRGAPVCARVGEQIGRGFLAWGASQLKSDDVETDAAKLLVQLEGMMLLKSLGMGDIADKAR